MSVDERTLTIIKTMALGPICYGDDGFGYICVHCESENEKTISGFSEIQHNPDCPVLLARTLLKELGTPMNIYKVVYQHVSRVTPKRQYWQTIKTYVIATTREEATKKYTNEEIRNLQAEFVREVPVQGVEESEVLSPHDEIRQQESLLEGNNANTPD